jgi:hypothetical protein
MRRRGEDAMHGVVASDSYRLCDVSPNTNDEQATAVLRHAEIGG